MRRETIDRSQFETMAEKTKESANTEKGGGSGGPPPPPRRYRRRLSNLSNVKTGLADVVRLLESGEMSPKVANALTYTYSTLANVIESDQKLNDIEERIRAVEERLPPRAAPATRRHMTLLGGVIGR